MPVNNDNSSSNEQKPFEQTQNQAHRDNRKQKKERTDIRRNQRAVREAKKVEHKLNKSQNG